ncbi:MAG: M20 family metallo-hydrolase [Spirochaetaceae bacterium]|jgi:succinyl-diaminopimelate desuccinylase|nr:M20 family metallo-hydrolase [Spirochaetaceae bacterium]
MKDKIFSFIDKSEDLAVELETALTKIPALSPDSDGTGELDKCVFLEGWLKKHGITDLLRLDAPDTRAKNGIRPNLVAAISGTDDTLPCLWIMSHLDVVPPGELSLWQSDPWTVVKKDGKLIGRGVEDNQQGLVSSVIAVLALIEQGLKPKRTVKLLFAADEECGSKYGIEWILKNKKEIFKTDDLVLIPDSGDSKGETMEIAEKNQLWVKLRTTGKQSHGSRPDLGNNAFLAASDLAVLLHNELYKKFDARDPLFEPPISTFEPTKKEANIPNINTIPADDIFYMDIRILPAYPVQIVLDEIKKIKTIIEKKYNVLIECTCMQSMESKATPKDSPLVKLLTRAVDEVYSVKARPIGIGGGTVAAYLRNADIDSVAWSRMDETAHQPNEYVYIRNILDNAKVMALLMI